MNCTDLITRQAEGAGRVLARVATHFQRTSPTLVLEPVSLTACVAAEAWGIAATEGVAEALGRAAFTAAPEVREGITRGEYALLLLQAARALGYEWTEGDNEPVIPKIPGQRAVLPAPAPQDPEGRAV
jgi:hypothetical protein